MNEILDFWNKPSVNDWMVHETAITMSLKFGAVYNAGKKDKRFKSGYRIKPFSTVGCYGDFTLPRDERYKVGQIWSIGMPDNGENYLGKVMVVSVGISDVKLISCSTFNEIKSIVFNGKQKLYYMGSMVQEGAR